MLPSTLSNSTIFQKEHSATDIGLNPNKYEQHLGNKNIAVIIFRKLRPYSRSHKTRGREREGWLSVPNTKRAQKWKIVSPELFFIRCSALFVHHNLFFRSAYVRIQWWNVALLSMYDGKLDTFPRTAFKCGQIRFFASCLQSHPRMPFNSCLCFSELMKILHVFCIWHHRRQTHSRQRQPKKQYVSSVLRSDAVRQLDNMWRHILRGRYSNKLVNHETAAESHGCECDEFCNGN